jgi:hypothetical protein
MLSPLKTLLSIMAHYDSLIATQSHFAPKECIVKIMIKIKLKEATEAKLGEVKALSLIMDAINLIPIESINCLDFQMLSQFIYVCPVYLQFLKGDLSKILYDDFMTGFRYFEQGKISDHLWFDTYSEQRMPFQVKEIVKAFIIPAAARIKTTADEKNENVLAYNDRRSNILIRYSHYLDEDEFTNVFETLCFMLSKKPGGIDQSIFDDLMNLMHRLSADQLVRFYEVLPKSVLSDGFSMKYKIPIFSFFLRCKDLPAAKDVSFNAGNALIHNYLHNYNKFPEFNDDFIELIRKYHHGASQATMNLFAEVMMGYFKYDGEKRLETFDSTVRPMRMTSEEYADPEGDYYDDWLEDHEMKFDGFIPLAKLLDILPHEVAINIGNSIAMLHLDDWLKISSLLAAKDLSLAAFSSVIFTHTINNLFEIELTAYLETPNVDTMSHLVVLMDLLTPEMQTRVINLLLAETTNNTPGIQQQAFDSLIDKFIILEKTALPERIQDFFDDINRDPFKFGRQMLSLNRLAPVGNVMQRNLFIDALLREDQRVKFVNTLANVRYSIIATKTKFPTILARLCEHLQIICENEFVTLGATTDVYNDIQPTLNNILALIFSPSGEKNDWKLDDASRSLLVATVETLSKLKLLQNSQQYSILNVWILCISYRIGNIAHVQKLVDSYLTLLNNPQTNREFAMELCSNTIRPLQFIVNDSLQFLTQDSGYELRNSIMRFFLNCLAHVSLDYPVFNLANIIVESNKNESELVGICKHALSIMNKYPVGYGLPIKYNLIEVLKIFLPFIKKEERFKVCGVYTHQDPVLKALYAVVIKSNERLQEISNVAGIPADCSQMVINYENLNSVRFSF